MWHGTDRVHSAQCGLPPHPLLSSLWTHLHIPATPREVRRGAWLMGPLTYIAAMIHAGSWKGVSKAIGATAAFLSVIYITALGSITVSVGMQIYWIDHKESAWHWNNVPSWMKLQFLGGIILCFFWAIVLMLWPWYSHTYTVISTDVETQPLITTSRKSVHQCWVIWFDTFLTWHI